MVRLPNFIVCASACLIACGAPDPSAEPDGAVAVDAEVSRDAEIPRDGQIPRDGAAGRDAGADTGVSDAGPPAHWRVVMGHDSDAVAAAFDAARAGDTVFFPSGTYTLTEPLPLKSGVNVLGDSGDPPVLQPAGDEILVTTVSVSDVTIRSLQLRNMRLRFDGPTDYSGGNITIDRCRFFDGAVSNDWNGGYVILHRIHGALISASTFERSSPSVGGRGILLSRCHHCVVDGSFIGTNRDLDDGLGYFKTAINIYGYDSAVIRSHDVKVTGTVMRRQSDPPCEYSNPEDGDGDVCQDHGLYAWGARDIQVVGNWVDGWEPTASGNSLKLRNGELMFVEGNRFRDSGVMLFTYERDPAFTHLEQIIVRKNRFDLGHPAATTLADSGLGYFRNFGAPSAPGYESELHLTDNAFVTGGVIRISSARAERFCVQGNTGSELRVTNSSGSPATTGCTADASWDRPLLGVFWGDFNNDGRDDAAHLFTDASGGDTWMMHLSDGDGTRFEEWPASVYAHADTEIYGAHVGDFDGDGFVDDIVHWGRIGSGTSSWRMYRSDGTSFAVSGFGESLGASAETAVYGVHVGDFDGDGRDDLVYRGQCADGDCWRVQRSTGSAFEAAGWTDGMYESEETATYGVQVGDFDGDGRDDLAYRGRCGGDGHACWRVQVSTGSAFGPGRDFGNSGYLTEESAHFGLRVGDLDGDGREDLGYMARCGSGERQWRYQVSDGAGFDVMCASDYRF